MSNRFFGLEKSRVYSETVEKVPKQIVKEDPNRNDLIECATINDPTITKGHETPKNQPLTMPKGFSTVSVVVINKGIFPFDKFRE